MESARRAALQRVVDAWHARHPRRSGPPCWGDKSVIAAWTVMTTHPCSRSPSGSIRSCWPWCSCHGRGAHSPPACGARIIQTHTRVAPERTSGCSECSARTTRNIHTHTCCSERTSGCSECSECSGWLLRTVTPQQQQQQQRVASPNPLLLPCRLCPPPTPDWIIQSRSPNHFTTEEMMQPCLTYRHAISLVERERERVRG